MNQLYKGGDKSKGQGFKGPYFGKCQKCGVYGHSAEFCPNEGKGFQGQFYVCGLIGHIGRFCPKGKGK